MSRLYATESGRAVPALGEELTRWRRARKRLRLPVTGAPATLYVLAFAHPPGTAPLRLAVNGAEVAPLRAQGATGAYLWHRAAIAPERLRAGENVFDLWTDTTAMDGWALAV